MAGMHATTSERFAARPATTALTKTGGFLTGFTHTLQPYIGCAFGCAYCYVQGMSVHRFHQPATAWGEYVHPRTGIGERLRRELARLHGAGELEKLAVFMSSATDPYQAAERRYRLARACLEAFVEYPPGLLVLQTRSPFVLDDLQLLCALGERCLLSFTIETDLDEVRRCLTPRCPAVERRWETVAAMRAAGLRVQIAVSPCLPYSDPPRFGAQLLDHADRVVIDTYVSGDGQGGRRTAATTTGAVYAAQGWGEWRAEEAALHLYDWLLARSADVGWSQTGFTAPALTVRGREGNQTA